MAITLLIVLTYFGWNYLEQRTNSHAEQIALRAVFDRWVDAGRPTGEQLSKFMVGRRDVFFNTQMYSIGGTNYIGQFALTNLVSHERGIFVITTNKILIFAIPDHAPELVRFSAPPW